MTETATPERHALAARYHDLVAGMLARVCEDQDGALDRAIAAVSDALVADHVVHVTGSGHSHLLAEEVFYRAGGIAAAQAILDPDLMLHLGAQRSTAAERAEGRAARVLSAHDVRAGDVLFVASNSGRNAFPIEAALEGRRRGATVIAITSRATARAVTSRHSSGKLLGDVAEIVIDNQAPVGDAALAIPGLAAAMAPVSTICGAFILNAIMAEAVARAVRRGKAPDVYGSANGPGAAAPLAAIAGKWMGRIKGL